MYFILPETVQSTVETDTGIEVLKVMKVGR